MTGVRPAPGPTSLWLLADSRLPTGGHAHSAGLEAVVARGEVRTPADVARVLAARVPTTGLVAAAAAAGAAARAGAADWRAWEDAVSARTPTAVVRDVSRSQGRALLRTVRATWPAAAVHGLGARPHQVLVLGVAVAAAGGGPADAAGLAVHHLVGQICSAAVRLLGLDPLALAGVHARALDAARPVLDGATAAGVDAAAADDPRRLPVAGTPRPEVLAVLHARSEGALFAS